MLEMIRLRPETAPLLTEFLREFDTPEGRRYFSPHPFDQPTVLRLAHSAVRDAYYLMLVDGQVAGYGMLRGWDEGYAVPSLGICIGARFRGRGLGWIFMRFLHDAARVSASERIRLKVHLKNLPAIALYRRLGYEFGHPEGDFMIGFKSLSEGDEVGR